MKKWGIILVVMISIYSFSINFGGGGYFINYIPADQLKQINPLKNVSFGDMILHGGGGLGIMPNGSFMGGEGFGGELEKGDYKISIGQGYFVFGRHINIFNILALDIGMGIGGSDVVISKKVDDSRDSKTIDGFVNNVNSVPYILELSREEFSLSPRISVQLNVIDFLSIFLQGKFTYNYSPENWKIEGIYKVTNDIPNYNYYYSFGAGVMWGF
ncbi:hypothetical protein [Marinitoga litoralis]|uniref:hypothetical protein n=1 Tax=Marinitoga litoralis TaxID=570855 RepID=UPI00195F71C6|nr:hypothetical protein [Marinitoga litoralis]MBM7558528.1 hypothetical protein [Marinitoga litoralis]